MVEHQTTLVKNLPVHKPITTEIRDTKRPESTEMHIKNWAAIFRLLRVFLLEQITQRHEGSSRLPNF